jgi:hypothetical protein
MKVSILDRAGPFSAHLDCSREDAPVVVIEDSAIYRAADPGHEGLIVEDATPEEWEALHRCGYFRKHEADPKDEALKDYKELNRLYKEYIGNASREAERIQSLAWASYQLLFHCMDKRINRLEIESRVGDLLEILENRSGDLSKKLNRVLP